jgi:hypothetical protein
MSTTLVVRDELDEFLHEELVTCLRSSAKFLFVGSFREQWCHPCDILLNHHRLAVPYSVIIKIFAVSKPTI